ncbi:MAG: hypothetical protein AAF682_09050 [Planctomycetota bacterium]
MTNDERSTRRPRGALLLGLAALGQSAREPLLREPSGLARTSLETADGRPLVLAVDDELPRVFLLAPDDEGGVKLEGELALDVPVTDLEAVAYDARRGFVYAITSHRRFDEPDEMVLVGRALTPGAETFENRLTPALLESGLSAAGIRITRDKKGRTLLDGRPWWKKEEKERHPFALELEGAACRDGVLYLGLKFPRVGGDAVLFTLPLPSHPRNPIGAIRAQRLDLGGAGITALDYDEVSERLLVASNPAVKPGAAGTATSEAYGHSLIHVFAPSNTGFYPDGDPIDAGRSDGKLEGLAVVGDELWLAYDGDRPHLLRRDRAELFDRDDAGER